jgi:phenylacetate-CoA ligase
VNREELYLRLPWALQLVVLNAHGWLLRRHRFNREFEQLSDAYLERANWSALRVREFRDQRLLEFLCWAEEKIPFYTERFNRADFSPIKQGDLAGFDRVQTLDKRTVQDNAVQIAVAVPEPTQTVHTSGTTGGGLRFPATVSSHREHWACWQRYRTLHGINLNEPCAYFGGRCIVSPNRRRPPFWQNNWAGRQLLFSAYHLSSKTAHDYIQALRLSNVRWIHGYPSAVALLASYVIECGDRIDMRWVTLGAENVTPAQQAVIEAAFKVQPIQHYGMAEAVANISQWPDGVLRVDEDFAFTEFVPRTDGPYEVVGTNFTNRAFPLIRYRVGDLVQLPKSNGEELKFGRTVGEIDGRQEDYVVTKDGALLGRLDHIFKDCVNIREAQIVQKRKGEILVNIVTTSEYRANDETQLKKELRQRLGDQVEFEIRHCIAIQKTARGKLRLVVSDVS